MIYWYDSVGGPTFVVKGDINARHRTYVALYLTADSFVLSDYVCL